MKSPFSTRRTPWLPWLGVLFLLGAALRLVNLDAPPLDFHPTRQLRNSLVARAIYYQSLGGAEPEKLALAQSFRRAVGQYEPPIIETMVGTTFLAIGGESFAVARVYGTIFWLLAGVALFDLGRRIASAPSALIALAYYLVLPFGVQASRSFQPDPLMASAFVAGIYALYRWSEDPRWRWALLGAAFAGLAVLVKVVIVFLVAGAAIAAVLTGLGGRFWRSPQVWVMAALMILPSATYYLVITSARSSEYFVAWTVELLGLITSVHFYSDWLGFLGSLVGLTFFFIALLGTALAPSRFRWMLIGIWAGYLLYGLTLPFQMYTHSYYHLQIVPVIALGLVPVVEAVMDRARGLPRGWQAVAAVPVVLLVVYQAWAARSVLAREDFSDAPVLWRAIGEAIPDDADVVGLTQDYGYDLMYWGWKKIQPWPLRTALSDMRAGDRDIQARFAETAAGHDYFLVTAFGQLESQPALAEALNAYAIAAEGEGFVLYDLNAPK